MTVAEEIQKLKKEKDAIILAHYYVRPEVQDVADYIGDSFYLSKIAASAKEKTIVFCGVGFMGESAKILSPFEFLLLLSDLYYADASDLLFYYHVTFFKTSYT